MSSRGLAILSLFALVVVGAIAHRGFVYTYAQDFLYVVNAPCDTSAESCFIQECGEEELGCAEEPYKKVELYAYNAPLCLSEHSCDFFECGDIEQCGITYCSEDALEEGEICAVNPDLHSE